MAKIRLGLVVAQVSGAADGVVYSNNRNGRYIRARVKPTNPRSIKQQAVRTTFTSLSQGWRTLTNAQRTAWAALGAQMTFQNSLGETNTLSGNQAYISINQLKVTSGQAQVANAPALDSAPSIVGTSLTATTGATPHINVAFSGTMTAGQGIRVYATGVVSAGKTFFRTSEYRLLGIITGAVTSPVDLLTNWQLVYGPLTAGAVGGRLSFKLIPVSVNGIPGTSSRIDSIVA